MANVTGPTSSTDKAIARWNGTGGTVIQDSSVTISDTGDLSASSFKLGTFTFIDSSQQYFYGNGNKMADNVGNLYYTDGSRLLVDSQDNLYYGNNSNTQFVSHTGSIFYGNSSQMADASGNLYTNTQSSSDSSTFVATTAFVQNVVGAITAGLDSRPSCRVATTAALTATYSNGSSGVGATLTNSGTKSAISIDGVALSANDRVLVKNQATAAQNGIYTVTTVGSGSVNWVLTRSTDFNTASGTGVVEGAFTIIEEGTSNVGSLWIETGAGPFTIGTTAITFTQLQVNNASLPHVPTFQYLTSGSSATYTTPANCRAIHVEMVGGGAGGGALITNSGSNGGDTIFNSVHAKGGTGGSHGKASVTGGAGGSGGTGSATLRMAGSYGGTPGASPSGLSGTWAGGVGGTSVFGGAGTSGGTNTAGVDAGTNSGSGGGGSGSDGGGDAGGGGGGAGEYVILDISSPASTYTYTIGSGGSGGAAGTIAGGDGGSGFIRVTEYY